MMFGKMGFEHHRTMILDQVRLAAYRHTIRERVPKNAICVEIGAGTGILSHYLAEAGAKKVWSIEYFEETANFARTLLAKAHGSTCEMIQARSYDVDLKEAGPQILVTETIGETAFEENIVLLCYDFCMRHPSITEVIPSQLKLFCQPLYSQTVTARMYSEILDFDKASDGPFQFQNGRDMLLDSYCSRIMIDDLSNSLAHGPPLELASYRLGVDKPTDFEREISLSTEFNVVHLFFEAALSKKDILSSNFLAPTTHWMHAYIPAHPNKRLLKIHYNADDCCFKIEWV